MKVSLRVIFCAVAMAVMRLSIFMPAAEAKVVYTPANITINGRGSIPFDLDHDGKTDFTIQASVSPLMCHFRVVTITPVLRDGVVANHLNNAVILPIGALVNSGRNFYQALTIVTFFCGTQTVTGYLGLELQINGQIHYGWAQVKVSGQGPLLLITTLVGFAYETVAGKSILTGQKTGDVQDSATSSRSKNPGGRVADELSAQEHGATQKERAKHSHYKVLDMGTFGGPHSEVNFGSRVINREGTVAGGASTAVPDPLCLFDFPYCFVFHASQYQNNILADLGTLPGGVNSFAITINSHGTVGGTSENGLVDPITGVPVFEAVTWDNGSITQLGTLGGLFSLPNDLNRRGQAAGGAENTIPDPNNYGGALTGLPSPTQWHAALFHDGAVQDLGTLGTGPDSFALFVNERRQVAGMSYTSSIPDPVTGIPPIHGFFWDRGRMTDIASLGCPNAGVSGMNQRGQVAGTSDLAGAQSCRPFIWQRGVLRNLGTLGGSTGGANWIDEAGGVEGASSTKDDLTLRAFRWIDGHMTNLGSLNGDQCSVAFGGNSRGQVVGSSLSDCEHGTGAFLWENGGPMLDLNVFVPPGSGILLREGAFINDAGEIAVVGRLANGDAHAFILVPDGDCDDECEARIAEDQNKTLIQNSSPMRSNIVLPANRVREFRKGWIRR